MFKFCFLYDTFYYLHHNNITVLSRTGADRYTYTNTGQFKQTTILNEARGKCGSRIKAGFVCIFLLFFTNECFLVQCKPYQTKYPWDQLKCSVYWAFRLSEVFILVEYVHVRTKKFLFLNVSVCLVFGLPSLHYINLLAGLLRKLTYCENLIVYVCISELSFKYHVGKVHDNVFVSKHGLGGSMSRSQCGISV